MSAMERAQRIRIMQNVLMGSPALIYLMPSVG